MEPEGSLLFSQKPVPIPSQMDLILSGANIASTTQVLKVIKLVMFMVEN
jgi:hypothetical protein